MVAAAPKFYEIAKDILTITGDSIFVAHNVNFDYGLIRKEFQALGGAFKRKKLCTLRLSRKLFPGYKSYSLGNICTELEIPINGRHSARGDAQATVALLKRAIEADPNGTLISSFLNAKNKQGTLPPNLKTKTFNALPISTGIYYFKDLNAKIIYVGKAKNIKQRVMSHFRDASTKERKMTQDVADVSYMITGNELIAFLLESAEIKKHYPLYNRAQKRSKETIGLTYYANKKGIIQLVYNASKMIQTPIAKFYSERDARSYLDKLIIDFQLCPKHCAIERGGKGSCFSYAIKKCKGVCCQREHVDQYNARVMMAIKTIQGDFKNETLILKGRKPREKGVVFIKNGKYIGYAFTTKRKISFERCENEIFYQTDNSDIRRIISAYKRNYNDFTVFEQE
jgi:DNA polymerase-3 subunit epsilon